jgi:hypothetical protein
MRSAIPSRMQMAGDNSLIADMQISEAFVKGHGKRNGLRMLHAFDHLS